MAKGDAIEKIVRIVHHQSTPEQPNTVSKLTITMLATRSSLSLPEVIEALDNALERGLLVEEDGKFCVA